MKIQDEKITIISNPRCELVSGDNVSFLVGRLKTFIESLGLPTTQEKSSKDMMQLLLWDWFNYITQHNTDDLKDKTKWYRENKI